MLQIEMLSSRLDGLSKSVTRGMDFAELLLQIEILLLLSFMSESRLFLLCEADGLSIITGRMD